MHRGYIFISQLLEAGDLRQEFEDILWNHIEKEVAKEVQQWQINAADVTTPRQSPASYSTLGKLLVAAVEGQQKRNYNWLTQY